MKISEKDIKTSLARILIVDDEPITCKTLQELLSAESWIVEVATNGDEALNILFSVHIDVVVLDLVMPDLDGMKVLQTIQKKDIKTKVIFLSRNGTIEIAVQAIMMGAYDFLTKPVDQFKFIETICGLLEKYQLSSHTLASRLDLYVARRVSEPSLRLNDLCKHFEISRSYVSMLFQKHIGASFRQRLACHRVQMAMEMIKSTNDCLYIIAEECGFRNQARLTETFYRLKGMTPLEYRKICRDRCKDPDEIRGKRKLSVFI